MTRYVDERGGIKQYQYDDQMGLLVNATDCSGYTTRFSYDRSGALVRETNALGQSTQYLRNILGEIKTIIYPDGQSHRYEYNALGQVTQHTNEAGLNAVWEYTPRGERRSFTDRLKRSIQYTYNRYGDLIRLTNHNGASYRFERDSEGRLVKEHRLNGIVRALHYNAHDEIIQQILVGTDERKETIDLVRDPVGRLTQKRTRCATTDYQYDVLNNLLAIQKQPTEQGQVLGIHSSSIDLKYDALGRLITESSEWYAPTVWTTLESPDVWIRSHPSDSVRWSSSERF